MLLAESLKSQRGFTLIEVVCVLALLGIIVFITAPVIKDFSQSRSLELAARALAMDMRKTQQKAITAGWTQIIDFRRSANDYVLRDGKTGERSTIKLPEGIAYSTILFPLFDGNPRLYFRYTGSPNRGGTVSLINAEGDLLYIIVTPATGRVRISDQPPDNW